MCYKMNSLSNILWRRGFSMLGMMSQTPARKSNSTDFDERLRFHQSAIPTACSDIVLMQP